MRSDYEPYGIDADTSFCQMIVLRCKRLTMKLTADLAVQYESVAGAVGADGTVTLARSETTSGHGEKLKVFEDSSRRWNRRLDATEYWASGDWIFNSGITVAGRKLLNTDTDEAASNMTLSYAYEAAQVIASPTIGGAPQTRLVDVKADCGAAGAIVWQKRLQVTDSAGGVNLIKTTAFVCTGPSQTAPLCAPENCGNTYAVAKNGVAPGCQCCKPGSPEVAAGAPVCGCKMPGGATTDQAAEEKGEEEQKKYGRLAMGFAAMSSDFGYNYVAANCLVDSTENASMCVSQSERSPWWEASTLDGEARQITKVRTAGAPRAPARPTDRLTRSRHAPRPAPR